MNNPDGLYCSKCLNPLFFSCELSGWSLVEYIIFCHLLWWIGYYFLLIVSKQSEEWCCRVLTLFHGCLISFCSLRDVYVNNSSIDFKKTPLSPTKKYYLSYMFSYFLFDFFWMHFFGNETKIIYAHHIASILIIFNVLVRNFGGSGIAYGAAGLELTNPYLQLRWLLRSHGYYNTVFHKIVELWFMIMFTIIRLIGGTILMYFAIMRSEMDIITTVSFSFIYMISLVLQWQIIVFFRKKYILGGQRVLPIRSRVSISLYFQRRTLDQYIMNYSVENEEDNEKMEESYVNKESPISTGLSSSPAAPSSPSPRASNAPSLAPPPTPPSPSSPAPPPTSPSPAPPASPSPSPSSSAPPPPGDESEKNEEKET